MEFIALDPGSLKCGWAVGKLDPESDLPQVENFGVIELSSKSHITQRILSLHDALKLLANKYQPHVLGVEAGYIYYRKGQISLCMARGACLTGVYAGTNTLKEELTIYEFSPSTVKKAVGKHNAEKHEVNKAVTRLLKLEHVERIPPDAADALAVAICTAQSWAESKKSGEKD